MVTRPVVSARNRASSGKTGPAAGIRRTTISVSLASPWWAYLRTRSNPPTPRRNSRMYWARRHSPSVTTSSPACSWRRMANRT